MRYIICKEYKANGHIVQPCEGHHFAVHFLHHSFGFSLACLFPELQVLRVMELMEFMELMRKVGELQ